MGKNACQSILTKISSLSRMYVDDRSLEDRRKESLRVFKKYPDRVPCIVEPGSSRAPSIRKRKYLVPKDVAFSQLQMVIRQQIDIRPEKALFMFIANRTLPQGTSTVGEIYDLHKSKEDSLLYITYDLESVFG